MTPATFFKHFDTLADAPNAVARLREMILQMAVMGKLVAQDPKDEPGPAVRDRRAVQTDGLPCLPVHWHYANPDEISADVPHAFTIGPFGSNLVRSDYRDGGVPLVFVRDIRSETFGGSGTRFVDPAKAQELSAHMVQGGDVLITKMGDPPGDTAIYPKDRPPAIITADCIKLTPDKSVASAEYLRYAIRSNLVAEQIAGITMGIAHQKVSLKRLRSVRIPLPPRAEQDRIVAKVDELMRLCEELESRLQRQQESRQRLSAAALDRLLSAREPDEFAEHWQRVCDHFDLLYDAPETIGQLRQAILQLAVQGKLVAQDSDDEAAEVLLNKLREEKSAAIRAKRIRRESELPAIEAVALPFNVPEGWAWVSLGELAAIEPNAMTDGPFGSNLKTSHYIPEPGYCVIRLGNLGIGEFIWGKEGYIAKDHYESLAKYHISPGDLMIAGLAEPIGRCCEVPATLGPAVNKADCFRLRVHRLIDRRYVMYCLNSPVERRLVEDLHHGMTRLRINLNDAKSLPVPLPPLAEQHRIVAKVDHLMSLCDALEAKLQQSQDDRQRLLAAAVHHVLNGEGDAEVTATLRP